MDLSHVHTMTQTSEPRSSNSMLHLPWLLTQPKTRGRMRGTFRPRWSTKTRHLWASEHVCVVITSRTIPTNTSSRDHATSMFTRLAISVNCDHNWLTNSYGPPSSRVSISDDTLATTGSVASGAPDSSMMRSSAKGYSRSRTSIGPRRICSRRRSSSLSLRGFPSKSKTRHPRFSSLNRWSRAKCFTPW